jgi:hypothetical protein
VAKLCCPDAPISGGADATHSMAIAKVASGSGKEKANFGFSMLLQTHTYPEMLSAIRARNPKRLINKLGFAGARKHGAVSPNPIGTFSGYLSFDSMRMRQFAPPSNV